MVQSSRVANDMSGTIDSEIVMDIEKTPASHRLHALLEKVVSWVLDHPFGETDLAGRLLETLGAVTRVKWSGNTDTASVEWKGEGNVYLHVNFPFCRKHILRRKQGATRDAAFLFLHEAAHVYRSDFSRVVWELDSGVWRKVANLILDMYVNSHLFLKGFPPRETLTKRLYSAGTVSFLLMPPHVLFQELKNCPAATSRLRRYGSDPVAFWSEVREDNLGPGFVMEVGEVLTAALRQHPVSEDREEPAVSDLEQEGLEQLVRLYLRVWTGRVPLRHAAKKLVRVLPFSLQSCKSILYLGGHGKVGPQYGRARGDTGSYDAWTRKRHEKRIKKFSRVIEQAICENAKHSVEKQGLRTEQTVRPGRDRRAGFFLARDRWPVFFKNTVRGITRAEEAARVYIDSSGSMGDGIVDLISELVLGTSDLISRPVYMFATEVEALSLQELREGKRMTGGTKIEPVLEHARSDHLERILVVTDGHVEQDLPGSLLNWAEQNEVYTIFTGEAVPPLEDLSEAYWEKMNEKLPLS